ncbi:hypothetical protein VQ02_07370 [Methylobacterium variabile]|uniref:Uncharacterized protein n=1 Tax=Methylobacterium variabile TaxID=298794 RepID=A0A0J6T4E7_9HYPH|nr:hypothetical protein [Methylobacterium variabile]KMO40652.1 hypothetical protein VQ02_07370 [Methylobacterium variabile]
MTSPSIRTTVLLAVTDEWVSRTLYSERFDEVMVWLADRSQWQGYLEPITSAEDDARWYVTCPSETDALDFKLRWV